MKRATLPAVLRAFGFSAALTVAVAALVLGAWGTAAAATTLVLVAIEVVFSFDNAIVNAKVLGTLSSFWQKMFLSVGMIVAVLGMRVVFPIGIVAVTSKLPWRHVLDLALHHPVAYSAMLSAAHTSIAAFGGTFLLMLALDFFLDDEREVLWLVRVERFAQRISRAWLPSVLAAVVLCIAAVIPANHAPAKTLAAGLVGLATYLAVQLVTKIFGATQNSASRVTRTGLAAFTTFVYLEVLDASFSFDGVLGAFAVTGKVLLIAAGLGVGAFWVRSLTVFMVRRRTLETYRYLEHGAHYTILILAFLLLAGLILEIPDAIAGVAGIATIATAAVASRRRIG
ncbi:MAG TPA: DUF475 domain-containing protein [Candidatus Saccharimonadales bacterium]